MKDIQEHILECEALRSLIPSQLELLAAKSRMIAVSRGCVVFQPGDQADCVYVLASGSVRICHYDENGKKAILRMVWPGDLFGQCALVDPVPREGWCEVTGHAAVVSMPAALLHELMLVNPRLARDLMLNVGRIMRSLAFRLSSVLLRPKRRRLLDLLRSVAKSHGVVTEAGILIPAAFSHQELSEMIGSSRETITVILGQLKQEDVLTYVGRQIMLRHRKSSSLPETH